MHSIFHRRHCGYTLIELMLVLSITAVLLGIMMYRHSYTLTHSTFNQDCELLAATLKETGPQAKKIGMLLPGTLMTTTHPTKDTSLTEVIKNRYALWVICERKGEKSDRVVTASGLICHRSPVNVKVSNVYASEEKKKEITTGVWMDLYELEETQKNAKFDYSGTSNNINIGKHVARIIFEPNMTPRRAGVITITLPEGKDDENRSQRIDIERSGAITHNTVNASSRLQ